MTENYDMRKINKYKQYQYVVAFIQDQVKKGIKQIDIAQNIGKSNTYVNWLIKDRRKNKYIKQQIVENIAQYFDLSVDELLIKGKKIYDQKNNHDITTIKQVDGITQIHLHIHLDGKDHVVTA